MHPKGNFFVDFPLEDDEFISNFILDYKSDMIIGITFNTNLRQNLGIKSKEIDSTVANKQLKFQMEGKIHEPTFHDSALDGKEARLLASWRKIAESVG